MSWSLVYGEFKQLLLEGGTVLILLFLLGFVMFMVVSNSWLRLSRVRAALRDRISTSEQRAELENDYALFRLDYIEPIERRIPVIQVMIGVLPLAGLLGTVSGMLVTFAGLGSSGGSRGVDTIAVGVSEALVTTQIGLLFAIPGSLLLVVLNRKLRDVKFELQQRLALRMRERVL